MNTICTPQEAKQYSPLALAFLGDSVYEVMMRQRFKKSALLIRLPPLIASKPFFPKKKQPSTEEAAMQPGMPFPSMLPVPITERQPDWNVCLAICMS